MRINHFFKKILVVLCVAWFSSHTGSIAQNIPIGTWRTHISYRQTFDLDIADDKIFCASPNGIYYFSKADNSINTITKIDGLSGSDISEIGYSNEKDMLLVGYENGNLDIVTGNEVINYTVIKESGFPDKSINHFLFFEDVSYVSTDFGVVVFDLNRLESKESYLNLDENGETLRIHYGEIFNDSLFLATDDGVIAGNLAPEINLLDFNNWFRFNDQHGIPAVEINSLASFRSELYAAISNDGIYKYSGVSWIKEDSLQNTVFNNISAGESWMMISTDTEVWMQPNEAMEYILHKVLSQEVMTPQIAILGPENNYWIADSKQGLVSSFGGAFNTILPAGPNSDQFFRLFFHDDKMIGLPGGYDVQRDPLENQAGFYYFQNGNWSNYSSPEFDPPEDLTDIAYDNVSEKYLITSFGGGLLEWDGADNLKTINSMDDNYPFSTNLLSAVYSEAKTWITTFNSNPSVYFKDEPENWTSIELDQPGSDHILQIISDAKGNLWFRVDPENAGGIIVYNPGEDLSRWLSDEDNNGGLPDNSVNDIEMDLDGNVWAGTDNGIAYFPAGSFGFDNPLEAIRPVVDGRFLLRNERVTTIETDGGNRKWIGTENGLWLFNEFGEELIVHFTINNSPLLSNSIVDIEINPETGEVFIATTAGASSFRSDATVGESVHSSQVKIFPNPVTSDFTGTVGIEGLANDVEVKITDISGNLVWQTKANGGTASWDLRTIYGGRPSTGIYLIFSSTQDGSETFVGKIAIIN